MKKKIVLLMASLLIGVGALFPAPAFAATCGSLNSGKATFFGMKSWYYYLECSDAKNVSPDNFQGDKLTTSIWKVILTILNDLFYIAGFLSVILIIVSGFNFITSGGDAGKAAHAKKMLVGTIVGLVIVVLAQIIVNTVLGMMT